MNAPRITTPFGATTTAAEVVAGVDLTDKRAVVTGGASGIGLETARALASTGAHVTIGVRGLDAGQRVACEIAPQHGPGAVVAARLNLADLSSIAAFAARPTPRRCRPTPPSASCETRSRSRHSSHTRRSPECPANSRGPAERVAARPRQPPKGAAFTYAPRTRL